MPKKQTVKKKGAKTRGLEVSFSAPKGMRDILPNEQLWWDRVEKITRELADFYGFKKITTPIMESADFFTRVSGDADFLQKEAYTLKSRTSGSMVLRTDMSAPVVRAYHEHGLGKTIQPQKLFFEGSVFNQVAGSHGRHETHQFGFEIIGGTSDSIYDAQIVLMLDRMFKNLKIKDVNLKINSLGCRVCRPGYRRQLQSYYKNHEKNLCSKCEKNLSENPVLLLSCKDPNCQEFKEKAPNFFDKICSSCSRHFKAFLEYLDELEILYSLDNQLIRGNEYMAQTIFEFAYGGNEPTVLATGGRYDYLMEVIGGRVTPALGGCIRVEDVIETMKFQDIKLPAKNLKSVFMVHVGELAKKKSLKIVEELRESGILVTEALGRESIKAQLKMAGKQGSWLALIFGQKEVYEESIIVRDLRTGLQETVILSKIVPEIQRRLKEKPLIEEK